LQRKKNNSVASLVSNIVSKIREDGDSALVDFTKKYDRFDLIKNGFYFSSCFTN